jgi:hypothetical protein
MTRTVAALLRKWCERHRGNQRERERAPWGQILRRGREPASDQLVAPVAGSASLTEIRAPNKTNTGHSTASLAYLSVSA